MTRRLQQRLRMCSSLDRETPLSTGASGFLRLEHLALAPNATRLFGIWIGPHGRAAVRSVRRLRVSAHANFFPLQLRLLGDKLTRNGIRGNRVFSVGIYLSRLVLNAFSSV